jgi:hypothetical protein
LPGGFWYPEERVADSAEEGINLLLVIARPQTSDRKARNACRTRASCAAIHSVTEQPALLTAYAAADAADVFQTRQPLSEAGRGIGNSVGSSWLLPGWSVPSPALLRPSAVSGRKPRARLARHNHTDGRENRHALVEGGAMAVGVLVAFLVLSSVVGVPCRGRARRARRRSHRLRSQSGVPVSRFHGNGTAGRSADPGQQSAAPSGHAGCRRRAGPAEARDGRLAVRRVWLTSWPLRSWTISLGIRQIRVPDRSDLGNRCTASDRQRRCDTMANGPWLTAQGTVRSRYTSVYTTTGGTGLWVRNQRAGHRTGSSGTRPRPAGSSRTGRAPAQSAWATQRKGGSSRPRPNAPDRGLLSVADASAASPVAEEHEEHN